VATTTESRISLVKSFLNAEATRYRTSHSATLDLRDIGYHLDSLHEFERIGIRNLNDIETLKLNRVLDSVESLMKNISQN
jgi:hypothetical protein